MNVWKAPLVIVTLVMPILGALVGGCATGALSPAPEPIVTGDESIQLFAILRDEGHRSPALQDLLRQGSYLP
jgi:hypothetical protein